MRETLCVAAICIVASAGLAAADWHHPLYVGNGGIWRQRVGIEIRNEMDREALGEPVALRVGTGPGEADLIGVPARELRVCDADGMEMLYDIAGPEGQRITSGAIPGGSTLTIPAECPAHASVTYYAYYGNSAAWAVPDFLDAAISARNGGVEEGAGDTPFGWQHDRGDEQHRATWVAESPHSGNKCLKIVVAEGAQPTWIATRQRGIHIIGGAEYRMTASVRAENVVGYAGWYLHVGNDEKPMMIAPMLEGGDGTYDWKQVTLEFTAPEEANLASLGTVLRGTGTAWFDDVTLETSEKPKLSATASEPEELEVSEIGQDAPWYDDNPGDDLYWDYRVPAKVINLSDRPLDRPLIRVDLSTLAVRLRGEPNAGSVRVTANGELVPHFEFQDGLLFEGQVPARTVRTYYVYLSADPRIGSAGTSDYTGLVESDRNLVENPSFESGDDLPDDWPGGAEGERPEGVMMSLDAPGLFGKRAARLHIPHEAKKAWTGWRQDVPVEPGKTYLFAAWLRTEDIRDKVQLHAHCRNADGELCETKKHTGAGPALAGTSDWTLLSGLFEMPDDIASFQLHLTMLATGTVWHDGVVLAEAAPGTVGRLESRPTPELAGVVAWPVNAIVKVFQEEPLPREVLPARITVARNEKEPLQVAIRSPRAMTGLRVEVDPPTNPQGDRLTDLEIVVVGYVPIDHKTSYYRSEVPAWHRRFPTTPGRCDGWPGMWPDPLLPRNDGEPAARGPDGGPAPPYDNRFDLAAGVTQPIWITVSVPKTAPAAEYTGAVRLAHEGATLAEVPFTVHVWDFALPDESHVKAIYDLRVRDPRWQVPGKSHQELRGDFCRFMAERRVCPHRVYPEPKMSYQDGKVTADFGEFDEAAEYYFGELKLTHSYTPGYFYCFGWGHPPRKAWGEAPYEGEYPYEGVDRSKLRPEYKRAYQACLRAYWEHLKEKGWDDKIVLYISDEPWDRYEHIKTQMRALCDMIHEVDPDIPIYCSTWKHVPEWDGYLDVWGIGHYGRVPVEKMGELRAAGDVIWWTTDGQMCTDTPYCAVERLLPHYCFKYNAEAYEFWGVDWLTYDPYEFGWHKYIRSSGEPGQYHWVRYPNGDGFLAYPGGPVGHDGPVSSVRLEQAREGVEDYEYLYLLRDLVTEAKAAGKDVREAEEALALASELVDIPNAGGRYSTKILPNPDAVLEAKEAVAKAIEGLRG